MLTITNPIQLQTRTPMLSTGDGFGERIIGNYNQMTMQQSQQEMLHVNTAPPEYYFGGEGSTNIQSTTNINEQMDNRVEIINHLVNRIMLEPKFGMTYQDRVYITNALHKYGIRDERHFMRQIRQLKEEIDQTRQLTDIYWNYSTELNTLVNDYQESRNEQSDSHIEVTQNYPMYLHEEIMNRLQTAAVYQIVNNFHEQEDGIINISNTELQLSEQKRIVDQVLLQKLKNVVRGEQIPLIYRHENYYENEEITEEYMDESSAMELLNSAVLLNLIDNAYETRKEYYAGKLNQWLHIDEDVYENTQNTIERLQSHIMNVQQYQTSQTNLTELSQQTNREELQILQQILEQAGGTQIFSHSQSRYQEGDTTVVADDRSWSAVSQIYQENTVEDVTEEVTEANIAQEQPVSQARSMELLQQQLNRVNQQNIENYNRYQQNIRQQMIEQQMTRQDVPDRRSRQRRDSLAALSAPEEVVMTLREEAAQEAEQRETMHRQALEQATGRQDQISYLINQYLTNPDELMRQSGMANDMAGLVREIGQVERVHKEQEIITQENRETIKEVSRELVGQLRDNVSTPETQHVWEQQTSLRFVHRNLENQTIDEVTEQLIEQNRILSQQTRVQEQTHENRQVTNTRIEHINEQTVDHVNRDIEHLVNQNVSQQMSMISDQVYRQIERRLESEKRRRGL